MPRFFFARRIISSREVLLFCRSEFIRETALRLMILRE